MSTIDFDFPEAGFKGRAISFTEESFYRYLDALLRNADDADDGLVARVVEEPGFEEIERARRSFPRLANAISNLLTEDAGYAGPTASLEDDLTAATPAGVLRRAGLTPEAAAPLLSAADTNGYRLKLVTVRARDRSTLFACVLRTPEDSTLALIREAHSRKKGYGKAARSGALASIVWFSAPLEETFARYPAIAPLALAPLMLEMGDRSAEARFRRR